MLDSGEEIDVLFFVLVGLVGKWFLLVKIVDEVFDVYWLVLLGVGWWLLLWLDWLCSWLYLLMECLCYFG